MDADVVRTKVAAKTKVAVKLPGAAPSALATQFERRLNALQWDAIERSLDERGYAMIPALLAPAQCTGLAALYDERERFRSRVVMERVRFGVGEYKYFASPLPPLVAALRTAIYPHLARVANRWCHAMDGDNLYPADFERFMQVCRRAGQTKPTPLLLRYDAGGYNCLHQDLYGEVAFPLQLTCLLSRTGVEFSGGEFLLVENRPRVQSRGEAVVLEQGEAIIFANSERPVAGSRGHYRVTMRHGVSRVRHGRRFSLGVIFHDAK
ncbi:MAG TPA: 2OG-Fe(II) oxygenase [Candidatus Binataceae bacterium]|nr:2OG-Fe(II) oxygenase [Candidatus Binataceae bacterium]